MLSRVNKSALSILLLAGLSVGVVYADTRPGACSGMVCSAANARGGFAVCVGEKLFDHALHLAKQHGYAVQVLVTDFRQVSSLSEKARHQGVLDRISVRPFSGNVLPYVDGLINLLITPAVDTLPEGELMRVLAPGGVLLHPTQNGWSKKVKPWPPDIDQWTHFLHGPDSNEVAQDRQVGPPRGLQWTAGPRWCRSHEWPTSVQAAVTANGRLFTIIDEAPPGVYEGLPQKCMLVARDAFSGVLLWKVPLKNWQPEFGTGTGGRWQMHHTIPRRLVAVGDRVYCTLQFLNSPVSVLDAATGNTLVEALPGTVGADEIIVCKNVLLAKCRPTLSIGATEKLFADATAKDDTLVAVELNTNTLLWRKENLCVLPYSLAASNGRVVFHDMESLVCLDLESGRQLWRTELPLRWTVGGGVSLAIAENVVLFHVMGRFATPNDAKPNKAQQRASASGIVAVSLADGKLLWQRPGHPSLAQASTLPADIFVIGDMVWYGRSTEGYDLHTGQIRKSVDIAKLISPGHHYRCHRAKATCRYLIWPKRGAEFIDVVGDNHMRNDWLRAPCFTGLVPANGLLYVPPSQCFCYPGVKLAGYLALRAEETPPAYTTEIEPQLFSVGTETEQQAPQPTPADWPMYRHDPSRSGTAGSEPPENLRLSGVIELASSTHQAVGVGNYIWIVEKDAHCIRCFSAGSLKELWRFYSTGRIDSAPTYWQGRIFFGCRDGYVYCLDALTGALLWRFQAAPGNKQVMSYEQPESLWPVSGSLLVLDGTVYAVAGRSSFLDGGLFAYALDAKTGRLKAKTRLVGPWPDVQTEEGSPFAMEGALPDLLVSDGKYLYMGRIKFDKQLRRIPLQPLSYLGELDMGSPHLVATGGFLDDTGFDRLYWMHSPYWPGFYFAQHAPKSGQLVVFDDRVAYAVKYFYRRTVWSPAFYPQSDGYLLYADHISTEPVLLDPKDRSPGLKWLPEKAYQDRYRQGGRGVEKGTGWVRTEPPIWKKLVPLRIRAMVLAGDKLIAAGVPDVVPPDDPFAPFEGRMPGKLAVFRATDGILLKSYDLPACPSFDGMSIVQGTLYIATTDNRVLVYK